METLTRAVTPLVYRPLVSLDFQNLDELDRFRDTGGRGTIQQTLNRQVTLEQISTHRGSHRREGRDFFQVQAKVQEVEEVQRVVALES